MKKSIIFYTLLIMTACSAKLLPVSEADAERGNARFPGTTLATLQHGQVLYQENCRKCHGLKAPASQTEAEWREIVPRMAKKAKVNAATEELILRYVITMSEAAKP